MPFWFEFELVVLREEMPEHVWRIHQHDSHVHDYNSFLAVSNVFFEGQLIKECLVVSFNHHLQRPHVLRQILLWHTFQLILAARVLSAWKLQIIFVFDKLHLGYLVVKDG